MTIDFEKQGGLVPVTVQDSKSMVVLMVGFMNEEAYKHTLENKKVTFFSRTKNRLWTKGETSGNFLLVDDILIDCDNDTILIKSTPVGPVCHTGAETCFNEKNDKLDVEFLKKLVYTIKDRKKNPSTDSYTSKLFAKGINKMAQKVGEEAVELVIEAKDNDKDLFIGEAADLLFHYLVLIEAKNYSVNDVVAELKKRHK